MNYYKYLKQNLQCIISGLAIALVFVWRIFFSWSVNLIPDECSYWAWSRRMDWSYFDNSGMVAYIIRLSTELFGISTPFTVRFPFIVLSALTTYFIYKISFDLFNNEKRALGIAALFNITPLALLGGSCAIHDNALVFFWTLTIFLCVKFLKNGSPKMFLLLGLTSGLAIQSKYTGVLLPISIFSFLLISREHRKYLARPEPWVGAVIALIITIPIIYWNYHREWASLYHILYIGSGSTSIWRQISDGLGYHAAQFLLVSPVFYILLVYGIINSLRSRESEFLLLLSFSLPLCLFGILSFRGHVEANWAAMGYVSAGILSMQVIGDQCSRRDYIGLLCSPKLLYSGIGLSVLPVVLIIVHAWVGLVPTNLERRFAKEDRIIWETRDWNRLGAYIGSVLGNDEVIAGDSYQLCALLEFNVPGQPFVRYLAPWKRPTQFDVWEPSYDNLKGKDILFVTPLPLQPSSDVRTTIYENFESIEALEPFDFLYRGEPIRTMYLYRGRNFNPFSPKRLGPRSLFYKE